MLIYFIYLIRRFLAQVEARVSDAFHVAGVDEWLGWRNCLSYKQPRSYLQFS
jgi:hypothetical protein